MEVMQKLGAAQVAESLQRTRLPTRYCMMYLSVVADAMNVCQPTGSLNDFSTTNMVGGVYPPLWRNVGVDVGGPNQGHRLIW
jgi:hypothetical protein